MLILRRNKGQAIRLSNDVEITVLNVNPYQVKLGINAPTQVRVMRKEVLERGQSMGKVVMEPGFSVLADPA